MTEPGELSVRVEVRASVDTAWRVLTTWASHHDWMLGTNVRVTSGDGASVGSELAAFTGVGRLGFVDTMRITEWRPPYRCVVVHTGKLVRGTGVFEVAEGQPQTVTVTWAEHLDLPLGVLGSVGWPLLRPIAAAGLRWSLRRLARLAEANHGAGDG